MGFFLDFSAFKKTDGNNLITEAQEICNILFISHYFVCLQITQFLVTYIKRAISTFKDIHFRIKKEIDNLLRSSSCPSSEQNNTYSDLSFLFL